MARLRQKAVSDAGVYSPTDLPQEINDQGGKFAQTPRSSYAINETITLTFTNKIVEQTTNEPRSATTFADGAVRPGTAG